MPARSKVLKHPLDPLASQLLVWPGDMKPHATRIGILAALTTAALSERASAEVFATDSTSDTSSGWIVRAGLGLTRPRRRQLPGQCGPHVSAHAVGPAEHARKTNA